MKLIKPKVELLDRFKRQQVIGRIATVARTCYKSEGLRTADTDAALVKRLIENGHEAMIEFVDVTVKFTCDRGVSHEIVRHRLSSFAQESTRYCNYSKDKFGNELTFIIPSWLDIPEGKYEYWDCNWVDVNDRDKIFVRNRTQDGEWIEDGDVVAKDTFLTHLEHCETSYMHLTKSGWSAEKARAVLPMSVKTEVCMKCNLREWRHFLSLRCAPNAHPDIRVLALDLLKQLHEQIPIIFDDIYNKYYGSKI